MYAGHSDVANPSQLDFLIYINYFRSVLLSKPSQLPVQLVSKGETNRSNINRDLDRVLQDFVIPPHDAMWGVGVETNCLCQHNQKVEAATY